MTAGERIFVDFLPGQLDRPAAVAAAGGDPRACRARSRRRAPAAHAARRRCARKKKPPVRVRALVQPTFVRFVFEVPDGGVSLGAQ